MCHVFNFPDQHVIFVAFAYERIRTAIEAFPLMQMIVTSMVLPSYKEQ